MPRSRPLVLAAVSVSVLALAGGVAHAASTPPPVRHATATTRSSTQVVLSWTNPTSPAFDATVVRVARGTKAPAGPAQGRHVATVRKARHSLTVGKLAAGVRYTFALFASDGHGDFGPRTVVRATTGPAPVTNVEAFAAASAISLRWTNPKTKSFARVVARYAKGHRAPPRPTGGRALRLTSPKATTATMSHLRKDTTYSVSIWTRDHKSRLSTRRQLSFTTNASPAANGAYVGRVTDTSGAPLAQADVQATDYAVGGTYSTSTGSDGRFVLALPAGQNFFVDIGGGQATGGNSDATGYQGFATDFVVSSGATTNGGTVALRAGGAVTGRVTDAAGHPLQGVVPYATPNAPYVDISESNLDIAYEFDPDAQVGTGADGSYTLKGLPPEADSICFSTASEPITGGTSDSSGYAAKCDPATIAAGPRTTTAHGDTALDATSGASISGRVTDPSGSGLANIALDIEGTNVREQAIGFTTTGTDGRYRVSGLAAGSYRICVFADDVRNAAPSGYRSGCRARLVTVTAGKPATENLVLQPGAAVTGKVVGPTGRPLAGVQVAVEHPKKGDTGPSGTAVTDASGHYTVKGLPATTYSACFETSSATGADDPTGAVNTCSHDLFAVRIGAVRTGIDQRLGVAGAISGTLTNSAGHPVSDAAVDIESTTHPFEDHGGFTQTDDHGRYVVRGLSAGEYRVCFTDLDATSAEVEKCVAGTIAVRVGHTRRNTDAVLPAAASLVVSVHDSTGHPISGVDAAVLSPCTEDGGFDCTNEPVFSATKGVNVVASWTTGASGTVKFDDLRAGHYVVCLFGYYGATSVNNSPTGYVDACSGTAFNLTITKDQTKAVARVLAPAGVVTGRVTDSSGHPVRGVRVHVTHSAADNYYSEDEDFEGLFGFAPSGPAAYSYTARDGTYSIRSVAPGGQTVCMDAQNAAGGASAGGYLDQCVGGQPGSEHGSAVSVTAGATTSGVNLALTSGAAIAGTVRSTSGHGVANTGVEVFATNGDEVGEAQTTGSGRYTVSRLGPGAKIVCFDAYKYASQCYDRVAWNERTLPAKAKRLPMTAGVARTGIDAVLHKS